MADSKRSQVVIQCPQDGTKRFQIKTFARQVKITKRCN